MEQSVSVIIPAYNDQGTIEEVISEAREVASSLATDYEILVVNDASRDGTGALLDRLAQVDKAIRVIHHETNRGYGATIAASPAMGRRPWTPPPRTAPTWSCSTWTSPGSTAWTWPAACARGPSSGTCRWWPSLATGGTRTGSGRSRRE